MICEQNVGYQNYPIFKMPRPRKQRPDDVVETAPVVRTPVINITAGGPTPKTKKPPVQSIITTRRGAAKAKQQAEEVGVTKTTCPNPITKQPDSLVIMMTPSAPPPPPVTKREKPAKKVSLPQPVRSTRISRRRAQQVSP